MYETDAEVTYFERCVAGTGTRFALEIRQDVVGGVLRLAHQDISAATVSGTVQNGRKALGAVCVGISVTFTPGGGCCVANSTRRLVGPSAEVRMSIFK